MALKIQWFMTHTSSSGTVHQNKPHLAISDVAADVDSDDAGMCFSEARRPFDERR
jgi:hypothetical protein